MARTPCREFGPGRAALRAAAVCVALVGAAAGMVPAGATEDLREGSARAEARTDGLQVNWTSQDLATLGPPHHAGIAARSIAHSLDTLWVGQGRAAVGLGVQQSWQAPDVLRAPAAGDASRTQLVLSLGWRTGTHRRLTWQSDAFGGTPGVPNLAGLGALDAPDAGRARLDLRRSDAYRAMLRGSLRMNLGRDASLSLKPRGRRLGVTYNRRW